PVGAVYRNGAKRTPAGRARFSPCQESRSVSTRRRVCPSRPAMSNSKRPPCPAPASAGPESGRYTARSPCTATSSVPETALTIWPMATVGGAARRDDSPRASKRPAAPSAATGPSQPSSSGRRNRLRTSHSARAASRKLPRISATVPRPIPGTWAQHREHDFPPPHLAREPDRPTVDGMPRTLVLGKQYPDELHGPFIVPYGLLPQALPRQLGGDLDGGKADSVHDLEI